MLRREHVHWWCVHAEPSVDPNVLKTTSSWILICGVVHQYYICCRSLDMEIGNLDPGLAQYNTRKYSDSRQNSQRRKIHQKLLKDFRPNIDKIKSLESVGNLITKIRLNFRRNVFKINIYLNPSVIVKNFRRVPNRFRD